MALNPIQWQAQIAAALAHQGKPTPMSISWLVWSIASASASPLHHDLPLGTETSKDPPRVLPPGPYKVILSAEAFRALVTATGGSLLLAHEAIAKNVNELQRANRRSLVWPDDGPARIDIVYSVEATRPDIRIPRALRTTASDDVVMGWASFGDAAVWHEVRAGLTELQVPGSTLALETLADASGTVTLFAPPTLLLAAEHGSQSSAMVLRNPNRIKVLCGDETIAILDYRPEPPKLSLVSADAQPTHDAKTPSANFVGWLAPLTNSPIHLSLGPEGSDAVVVSRVERTTRLQITALPEGIATRVIGGRAFADGQRLAAGEARQGGDRVALILDGEVRLIAERHGAVVALRFAQPMRVRLDQKTIRPIGPSDWTSIRLSQDQILDADGFIKPAIALAGARR